MRLNTSIKHLLKLQPLLRMAALFFVSLQLVSAQSRDWASSPREVMAASWQVPTTTSNSPRDMMAASWETLVGPDEIQNVLSQLAKTPPQLKMPAPHKSSRHTPTSLSSGAFSRSNMIATQVPETKSPSSKKALVKNVLPLKPAPAIREIKVESPPVIETDSRQLPSNFIARLVMRLPESLAEARQAIGNVTAKALSLTTVAADHKFLEAAWISFDAGKQMWQATWQKPPLFHFGMILLPALVDRLKTGEAFSFESQGKTAVLCKNDHGQLCVQQDGQTKQVGAKDLKDLLQNKINADGLSLFLDRSGNLVLQANGARALAMASGCNTPRP